MGEDGEGVGGDGEGREWGEMGREWGEMGREWGEMGRGGSGGRWGGEGVGGDGEGREWGEMGRGGEGRTIATNSLHVSNFAHSTSAQCIAVCCQ